MTSLPIHPSAVVDETEAEEALRRGMRDREAPLVTYDAVDASGDESFPASDPPSWWSG
jgi:hypothetical protein